MKKRILFLIVPVIIYLLLQSGLAASSTSASSGVFQIYPKDHVWNVPVDTLPVDAMSSAYVNSGNPSAFMYLFREMPYNVVNSTQPKQRLTHVTYSRYSDDIPYPIPESPLIENNRDRHMLIINPEENMLYEMYHANQSPTGTWSAGVAVVYDLSDYALRPDHTVSADAAGLPILPGIIRYEEIEAGRISHALRFATNSLQNTYIWPARAAAGSDDSNTSLPPHGQRFRLKPSFNLSVYSPQEQIVLQALKTYGMILADYNGGDPTVFSIYAAPDERWTINFTTFKDIKLTDFEAVDESSLMINKDSGQARVAQQNSGNLLMEGWIIAGACTIILAISYGVLLLKRRSRRTLADMKTSAKKTVHQEPPKMVITEEAIPAVPEEKGGTGKNTGPQILPDLKSDVRKSTHHSMKQPSITEETIPVAPPGERDEKKSAMSPVSRSRVEVVGDHATLTPPEPGQPGPTPEDRLLHRRAENKKISPDQELPAEGIRRIPKITGSEKETNNTTAELSRLTRRKDKKEPEKK